jgi:hypothetical protein
LSARGSRDGLVREDPGSYDADGGRVGRVRFSPWLPITLTRRLLSDLRAAYRLMEKWVGHVRPTGWGRS